MTDYECLLKERSRARTNPLALVEALQRGQGLLLPEPQVELLTEESCKLQVT